MIKCKEIRLYHFTFTSELTKGGVSVKLFNADRQQVMCLTEAQRIADLKIDKTKRYYLVVRFRSATGKYDIHWD